MVKTYQPESLKQLMQLMQLMLREPRPDTPASSDVSAPSAGGEDGTKRHNERKIQVTKWEPHPPTGTFKPWWMTNIFGGKNGQV